MITIITALYMKTKCNHIFIFWGFFLILLSLNSCNTITIRPFKDSISGIKFGEIHQMGGTIYICVEEFDTLSMESRANFLYCLRERELAKGRTIDNITICKYYCYIDQVENAHVQYGCEFNNSTTDIIFYKLNDLNNNLNIVEQRVIVPLIRCSQ